MCFKNPKMEENKHQTNKTNKNTPKQQEDAYR